MWRVDGAPAEPVVLERATTERGELVLRRVGRDVEVISNGVFLMDTRDGRSERALVRSALDGHPEPRRILIGGLGVGFSLVEAVAEPALQRIDVVEIEQHILDWHRTHLAYLSGAALADPRVRVVIDDVRTWLASGRRYDVLCLDIDNGPDWTVSDANAQLYTAAGLDLVSRALAPGGVLAVWSARRVPEFASLLRRALEDVRTVEVPGTIRRAEPDLVYIGRVPVRR